MEAESVLGAMERDAEAIARQMVLAIREEIDEYRAVRDPALAQEVLAHGVEHVLAFVRSARDGGPPEGDDLEFVRRRGAWRARGLMPLDALLETYLIGQRTVWEAIVAAAGDTPDGMRVAQELTAFTFRYTHAISVAVSQAYTRESQAVASEAERARRDLFDHLLAGHAPGADEERRAETLGLQRDTHVVVVAAAEPDAENLVSRALASQDPHSAFVVSRNGEIVAVVAVTDDRGPSELRADLEASAVLLERAHGVSLRAGVSTVCRGLAELARGYGEAARALRHADAGSAVVALEEISLFEYLTTGADDTAHRLIPDGAGALLRAEAALSQTLEAYAECDLNVARTAERLDVHANTVHYRLRRVRELTGRDPRHFADLVELTAALRLAQPS